jgi:hypothetical protein
MKKIRVFLFCLMTVLACSVGAAMVFNQMAGGYSPPDITQLIDNAAPVLAVVGVAAPADSVVKLKDYFTRYKNSAEVFLAGGTLFHNAGDAQSYARGAEVTKFTRDEIMTAEGTGSINLSGIAEIDLHALSYDELKRYIKELKIETVDNKGDTLLAALEEYRKTLQEV